MKDHLNLLNEESEEYSVEVWKKYLEAYFAQNVDEKVSMENLRLLRQRLVANRIKSLRLEHGLTMKDLATRLGVSESMVSRYESHQSMPRRATLMAISQIFDVNYDWLIGDPKITDKYLKNEALEFQGVQERAPVSKKIIENRFGYAFKEVPGFNLQQFLEQEEITLERFKDFINHGEPLHDSEVDRIASRLEVNKYWLMGAVRPRSLPAYEDNYKELMILKTYNPALPLSFQPDIVAREEISVHSEEDFGICADQDYPRFSIYENDTIYFRLTPTDRIPKDDDLVLAHHQGKVILGKYFATPDFVVLTPGNNGSNVIVFNKLDEEKVGSKILGIAVKIKNNIRRK